MLSFLSLVFAAAVPDSSAVALNADRAAHLVVLAAHGEGAQIYQCQAALDGVLRWSFREPIAALVVGGQTVGRHYAGPHWALDDGSLIRGKVTITAPGFTSGDIALLKLDVVDNKGLGVLGPATLVYRTNTHGGVLTGGCPTAGMLRAIAYSADYIFAK